MDGLSQSTENGRIGPELQPESTPATLNIKVAHGPNQHEVAVPSNSTFGDLKSIIVQKTGLKPETCKLLFRGKEKDDDEFLQSAGLKDNAKVLLMEDTTCRENVPEEVQETIVPEEVKEPSVISLGEAAVAEVRREVDTLSDQVVALQAVIESGTQVENKDIIYLTEMLMRVLLRLDGIVAEGEGRIQRKMEVRRVQSLVETMDILKTKNSIPISNGNNVSVTTQWETFETAPGSLGTMSTAPASVPTPTLTPPSTPAPAPVPSSTPVSSPTPISVTSPSLASPNPIYVASSTPVPSSNHTSVPLTLPTSNHVPSSASSLLPSSTKVTQEWENFD